MILATDSGHGASCSERVFSFSLHFGPRRWVQLCYPHFTEETTEAHGIKSLGERPELHCQRRMYTGPGTPKPTFTAPTLTPSWGLPMVHRQFPTTGRATQEEVRHNAQIHRYLHRRKYQIPCDMFLETLRF